MSANTCSLGDSEVSPPASGTLCCAARPSSPSRKPSSQSVSRATLRGKASERNAAIGRAPIAARSLSPRASARCPMDSGECQSRRKCRPSREKSVVTSRSCPGRGRRMAQSSPMPNCREVAGPPARRRIRSIKASSPPSTADEEEFRRREGRDMNLRILACKEALDSDWSHTRCDSLWTIIEQREAQAVFISSCHVFATIPDAILIGLPLFCHSGLL